MTRSKLRKKNGFTFIETLIGVSLLLALIVVSASMIKSLSFSHNIRLKQTAYAVLSEEIEYLRHIPYEDLDNGSEMPFKGILSHIGSFVVSDSIAQSGTKSIMISKSTYATQTEATALITPPIGPAIEDGTYTLSAYIPSTNNSDWRTGILFRAKDNGNGYELLIDSNSIDFISLSNNTATTLASYASSISTNTWHTIAISASGTNFDLYLDAVKKNNTPIISSDHTKGSIGIVAFNNTSAYFDDAILESASSTQEWNFDEVLNRLGEEPDDWKRNGLYDLPSAEGKLTISDAEADPTSPLKLIQATVTWDDGKDRSASLETYVSQTGISK